MYINLTLQKYRYRTIQKYRRKFPQKYGKIKERKKGQLIIIVEEKIINTQDLNPRRLEESWRRGRGVGVAWELGNSEKI